MKNKEFWGTLGGMLMLVGCSGQMVSPIGGGPSAGSPGGGGWVGGVGGSNSPSYGGFNPSAGYSPVGSGGSGSTGLTVSSQFAGTWTGYVENYKFPDGSDTVTLTLSADGTTPSIVRFGNSPAPAPATDPDVGYPTEYEYSPQGGYPNSLPVTARGPVPGFSFTAAGTADGSRLQFDVAPKEVWAHWCEIQAPVEQTTNYYSCAPSWSSGSGCAVTDPQTQQLVAIDCAKLDLCNMQHVCECTAQSCSSASVTVATLASVHFDLNVDGNNAHGSVNGLYAIGSDGGLRNLHLTKN